MFKVRNIFTGEIFAVYAVNPGGMFLFYAPPEHGKLPTWIWGDMDDFEPVEDSE